jgi:hypothetical protein
MKKTRRNSNEVKDLFFQILRLMADGQTTNQACSYCGVPRTTFENWRIRIGKKMPAYINTQTPPCTPI